MFPSSSLNFPWSLSPSHSCLHSHTLLVPSSLRPTPPLPLLPPSPPPPLSFSPLGYKGAQVNPTIMAVALPREVIEIEIPDTAGLDTVPYGDEAVDTSAMGTGTIPKRR